MVSKKPNLSIQLPRLDMFDFMSIALWVGILVPAFLMPSSATFSFARSIFFIIWTALLLVYVSVRVFVEKKIIFYSATFSNVVVALVGVVFLLSLLMSAAHVDSLFGYDLSFSSSALVLISTVMMYFGLKLAGLSLEYAVSRTLSVLPVTLVLLDIVSIIAFLLPAGFYTKLLGSYAQYFTFTSNSPLSLLGGQQIVLFVHIVALIVAAWQLATAYKKDTSMSFNLYRRAANVLILTIAFSYLFFYTFAFSLMGAVVVGVSALLIAVLVLVDKTEQVKFYGLIMVASVLLASLLGLVWMKAGVIGAGKPVSISSQVTNYVVQQSFLNAQTPMWRQLVGFGVGTFPYLYMQYRPIEAAQTYGNSTFFFKPASFVTELFVENGLLGVLIFVTLIIAVILAHKKASSKTSLIPELSVIIAMFGVLMVTSSSLPVLVMLFVALAAYFDKTEALPELLPSIKAIDLKESTYTNKSVSRGADILLGVTIVYALVSVGLLVSPTMTMVGYTKALQRYSVARQQVANKDSKALTTYSDAYSVASSYQKYCKQCTQLKYLSLTTLLATSDLYSGLTTEQRNASQELKQVKNMIMQSATGLIGTNSTRYDYWLTVSQAYRGISDDENSTTLGTLAIQAARNSLSVDQYSVDALSEYIDMLLRLGNDTSINTEIKTRLGTLKSLVGTPYQVQFIEGVMLAREANYDGAIKAFEAIKKEAADSTSLSNDDKKTIITAAEQRISDVKKLQAEATKNPPKVTTTPIVKITPSVTATPKVTSTPTAVPTTTTPTVTATP